MDARLHNLHNPSPNAQIVGQKKFLRLPFRIHVDSFFSQALALELSGFCYFFPMLSASRSDSASGGESKCEKEKRKANTLLAISRQQNLDPMMDQKVETPRGLRMTLQRLPGPQEKLMALRSGIFIGGISVTESKGILCLKGIAYTAEAA